VPEILGIIDRGLIFESSSAIIEGSTPRCLAVVERVYNQGYDIKEFYRALMGQFRNLLVSLIAPEEQLIDMSESDRDEIRRQAETAGAEKLQVILNFLISREEGLRFTTYPRLVLEVTMIKLCTLEDYLSFGDIMKKIALLEERLAASPPAEPGEMGGTGGGGPTSRPSKEESVKAEEVHIDKIPAPSLPPANEAKGWPDFLRFVSGKSQMFYTILKDWHFKALTDDLLELECAGNGFSSRYFDDQKKLDQLTEYCRTFYQRDIRVKLQVKPQASNSLKERSASKDEAGRPAQSQDLPAEVRDVAQNVLDLFEGKLINN
jgi:DNA polymerase-3 subunit gamma/tau